MCSKMVEIATKPERSLNAPEWLGRDGNVVNTAIAESRKRCELLYLSWLTDCEKSDLLTSTVLF